MMVNPVVATVIDPQTLAGGLDSGDVMIMHGLPNGRVKAALRAHSEAVTSLAALSPELLASASLDQTVKVWNLKTYKLSLKFEPNDGPVNSIVVLASGLLAAGSATAVTLLDTRGGPSTRLLGHAGPIHALAARGGRLVSASADTTLKVWNLETERELMTLQYVRPTGGQVAKDGHTGTVLGVCFISDKYIASCGRDRTIKVWDLDAGACVQSLGGQLNAHTEAITCVASCGGRLVSTALDGNVIVWDWQKRVPVRMPMTTRHTMHVCVLDDRRVVVADRHPSTQGMYRVWDVQDGNIVAEVRMDRRLPEDAGQSRSAVA